MTQHSTQPTAPRQFFGEKGEQLSSLILLGPPWVEEAPAARSSIIELPWRCSYHLNVPSLFPGPVRNLPFGLHLPFIATLCKRGSRRCQGAVFFILLSPFYQYSYAKHVEKRSSFVEVGLPLHMGREKTRAKMMMIKITSCGGGKMISMATAGDRKWNLSAVVLS
jgi:hypothetical protein